MRNIKWLSLIALIVVPLGFSTSSQATTFVETREQQEQNKLDVHAREIIAKNIERTDTVLVAEYTGKYRQPDMNDDAFLVSFENAKSIKGHVSSSAVDLLITANVPPFSTHDPVGSLITKFSAYLKPKDKYLILAHAQDWQSKSEPKHVVYYPYLIAPISGE